MDEEQKGRCWCGKLVRQTWARRSAAFLVDIGDEGWQSLVCVPATYVGALLCMYHSGRNFIKIIFVNALLWLSVASVVCGSRWAYLVEPSTRSELHRWFNLEAQSLNLPSFPTLRAYS